jgi:hypothetical protein
MSNNPRALSIIELVWSVMRDGKWLRPDDIAKLVPSRAAEVVEVLEFLVKFGFAQRHGVDQNSYRIPKTDPSPMEVAEILQAMGA